MVRLNIINNVEKKISSSTLSLFLTHQHQLYYLSVIVNKQIGKKIINKISASIKLLLGKRC